MVRIYWGNTGAVQKYPDPLLFRGSKRVEHHTCFEKNTGELHPVICKLAAAVEEDGKTIYPKMFGMAPIFAVYTFIPGEGFQFLESRSNPYQKTLQRGKTFDVYGLVNDCQALLAGHIGKKGIPRLEARGVRLFFGSGDVKTSLREIEYC